jgi:hypothetical protein
MCTDSSIYLSLYPMRNGYCGELFVIHFIILIYWKEFLVQNVIKTFQSALPN